MDLLSFVHEKFASPNVKEFPDFRAGDTVRVHCKITEGNKSRIQEYEGICIAIRMKGHMNGHFRVRKISYGIGVERVFPYHSPNVTKIELLNRGNSTRAKLYYLRDRIGKSARIGTDYSRESEAVVSNLTTSSKTVTELAAESAMQNSAPAVKKEKKAKAAAPKAAAKAKK